MEDILYIQNNYLTVGITRVGAEVCSIISKNTSHEYIWEGDPTIWGSHAPVLFPIIGCLKEGFFTYLGKQFTVPKHGFIRHNKNLVSNIVDSSTVEFSLTYDAESLKTYPFKFAFLIRFKLVNNMLYVEHEVKNDGNESMYFSLGAHPAFRCPVNDLGNYSDYAIEFDKEETLNTHEVLPNGLIGPNSSPLLLGSKTLHLTEQLFDQDALIFKHPKSKKVRLTNHLTEASISLQFEDFPYLGIWAKPGAKFVCIEPWLGISDNWDTDQDITKKEGIEQLEGGGLFKARYSIEINE
jgi:galactose mutarotase-like enzyme